MIIINLVTLLFCSTLFAQKSSTDSFSPASLEDNLIELLSWFPGEYDNHQQVYKEAVSDITKDKRHRQTHHIFHEVELDYIPGRTLYAQQSQHYDLEDLYRQRIYSFEIDNNENAVRLTIYTPNDPESLRDAHLDPSIFNEMSEEDFYLKPGCEVYWKAKNEQFEGYLIENACNYYSERFKTQVYLNETLILRKNALLLNDRATDDKGNLVFGVDDKGPTINLKEKPCK